ncbi:MAG: hypothetical protein NE334_06990 [Lentisphaeraceae bacterium]|nr:hypothetical protein [Lentisphaeraceae bacterium]
MTKGEAQLKRFRIITTIAILWATVLAVRLFYFSIINRETSLDKMESEGVERRTLRAMRGRILSADGQVLVESIRKSSLILSHRVQSHQLSGFLSILAKEMGFKRRDIMIKVGRTKDNKDIILKESMSLEDVKKFSQVFGVNPILFIKMSFERKVLTKKYKSKIGQVRKVDGQFVGVSGFEEKYDASLKGQDLIYEAMVDKRGKLIPETFSEIQKLISGKDVFLTEKEWP